MWGAWNPTKIVAELGIGDFEQFKFVELLSGSNSSVKIDYGANSDLGSHLAQTAPKSICTLEFDPESSSTNLNRWRSPIPSSATILVGFRAPHTVWHGLESICYHSYDLSITMFIFGCVS